jgi:two-component system chemotaxis response regulator CheB
MTFSRVVTIGASSGGLDALRTLASKLPADFQAPILVVQHIGTHESILPALLSKAGPLKAIHATDGLALEEGRIHVAPPDRHMMVTDGVVHLMHTAKENHTRPAIDPLFRSAAITFGPAAVGVVLTGQLDDGTSGLQAIKECGGVAVVQDPDEALRRSMPESALKYVKVDFCGSLEDIAGYLEQLVKKPAPAQTCTSEAVLHEMAVALTKGDTMAHLQQIGKPSHFTCPECQGTLWEIETRPLRYRCHTGHGFTQRTLRSAQIEAVDEALWSALRALQEEEQVLRETADTARHEQQAETAASLESEAVQIAQRIAQMRELMRGMPASHVA